MASKKQILVPGVHIVSIDPGKTTGVCAIRYKGKNSFEVLLSCEVSWESRYTLYDILSRYQPVYIVLESFRLYPHKAQEQIGSDFPSSRIIGMVEAYAQQLGLAAPTFQPAVCMQMVEVLPEHKGYLRMTSEHRKDAYKHARYFVVANDQR